MITKSQYQVLKDATISGFRKVIAGELVTFADDHASEWIDRGVLGAVGEYVAPEPEIELAEVDTEEEITQPLLGGIE